MTARAGLPRQRHALGIGLHASSTTTATAGSTCSSPTTCASTSPRRAGAGHGRQLPVEGHPGQLRSQGPADRHQPALPQRGRRHASRDVSEASGVATVTGRYPMTAAAADFDGDGWPDIYVACDSTASILYRNNRDGTFTDVARRERRRRTARTATRRRAWALAVGDFDARRPARPPQDAFRRRHPRALPQPRQAACSRTWPSRPGLGVQNRYVEWGAGMPDLDNDGRPDIVYVTGNVYPEIERQLPQYPHRGPARRLPQPRRRRASRTSRARSGPGAADAALEPRRRLRRLRQRRRRGRAGHEHERAAVAAAQRLRGRATAGSRCSSRARVEPRGARRDGRRDRRRAARRRGRCSASRATTRTTTCALHFGLGDGDRQADRIEVRWPSGRSETS